MSNEISNQNPTDADATSTSTTGEAAPVIETPAVAAAPSTAMAAAWASRKPLKERKKGGTPAVVSAKPAPVAEVVGPRGGSSHINAKVPVEQPEAAVVIEGVADAGKPGHVAKVAAELGVEVTTVPATGTTTIEELLTVSAHPAATDAAQPEPADGNGSAPEPEVDGGLLCDQTGAYPTAVKEPKADSQAAPAVGDVVRGIVTTKLAKQESGEQFAVLVTLGGGMKGLLHESQLNGDRNERPARLKALKRGEEVTVKVVKIEPDPKKAGRMRFSLSERAVVEDRLTEGLEGSIFEGTVSGNATTHVFVTLPNGLRGLLHVMELNGNRDQRDARLASLKAGERVTVKVVKVKDDPKRPGKINISLSERAASSDRLIADLRGATVTGTVTGFLFGKENKDVRTGAFVEIGNGLRGLLHVSQITYDATNEQDARKERDARLAALEVGNSITVQVINIEPDAKRQGDLRIALSEQGPARRTYLEELKAGGDRAFKAPAFAKEEHGFKLQLKYGLVGFLAFDELGNQPAETIKRGHTVRVKVASVDGEQVCLTRRGL